MYSMVTSSPFLGLSLPLPSFNTFLVTPIVRRFEKGFLAVDRGYKLCCRRLKMIEESLEFLVEDGREIEWRKEPAG